MSVRESFLMGIRSSRGYFVSTFLFGVMFGIAAVAAGIPHWYALLMSASVFSASAQFAALEFWQSPLPLGTIALSVLLVSTRNILLGMAMTHHFDGHSISRRVAWLFLLNDPGVVTALRLDASVDRLGYITGYGLSLIMSWVISTWVGLSLADRFSSTDLSALDFAGPLILATMMILFAKGSGASSRPWIVSGIAALIFHEIGMPDYLILPVAVALGVSVSFFTGRPRNA